MAEKLSVLNKIYYKLPVCLQNVMCGIKGYLVNKRRYNKKFYQYLKLYENKNVIPVDELKHFLQEAKNVPFYEKLFCKCGFDIDGKNIYEELQKLPILSKNDVVENQKQIINPRYEGEVIEIGTSGTTGAGLFFPMAVDAEVRQWAVWWRYRRNLGIQIGTWCGWFGG